MARKTFNGNVPPEDYAFEKRLCKERGVWWNLYVKKGPDWINLKVVADGSAGQKANYWIAWNGERFNQHKDVLILKENMPSVFNEVEEFVIRYLW